MSPARSCSDCHQKEAEVHPLRAPGWRQGLEPALSLTRLVWLPDEFTPRLDFGLAVDLFPPRELFFGVTLRPPLERPRPA